LSQVTELFNKLVHERENQDHIAELREAKTTLEERVRGNDNMLLEIRNGKASAEKREDDLRSGNDRLVEELTKLRDTALTTKKGSGPMAELQSLVMKWTSTNSSLAESLQRIEGKDRKLQGQEEHIQSLSEKLVQARAGQQKAEEETQRLSGRLAESAETASRGKVQLVSPFFKF
jgi:chromosome segregation ATPase